MTRQEFLAALKRHTAASPLKWRLSAGRDLRIGQWKECRCPLTFVCAKEKGDKYDYSVDKTGLAGRQLGLPSDEIDAISQAADGFLSCDRDLRAAMLKAVGIHKEERSWLK